MCPTPDFTLADSPTEFRRAAEILATGRGPFAIDTERASTYRYDDRAFLVQVHRRDAGIFLLAPEGHRDCVRETFAPLLNGADWILHAAGEDLPSLAELGLFPGTLFDTELASRIAGFERPNLAAMVSEFVGTQLEKSHGREDWSTTPLPLEWQVYAAYDVLYLNDLAEALTEFLDAASKLEFANQECAHLVSTHSAQARHGRLPVTKSWREAKGISALSSSTSLQIAKALWQERDAHARATDTAPNAILPTKVLIEIARAQPRTRGELISSSHHMRHRKSEASLWFGVISEALDVPARDWPDKIRRRGKEMPSKSSWQKHNPESWEILTQIKAEIAHTADEYTMAAETLLQSAVLRQVVWEATTAGTIWDTGSASARLRAHGARKWQAEITAPVVASVLAD